jgi:hypothetical membrane protein
MDAVNPNRLRWGALAWLLTVQFFVVEAVAAARYAGAYSRVDDTISALGASASAAHQLMNASFVLQAALILAGVVLLRPLLRGAAGQVASVLLVVAAAGVLLVGVFPSDGNALVHAIGAVAHLVGGGLGLIALAYAVRPRSEALGTTLALLGLVGTAATVFFLTGVTEYLGEGSTERVAAYVIPIGLALTGAGLWRLAGPGSAERQAERAAARREQDRRDREREAALEAAGRRSEAPPADNADPGHAQPHDADPDDADPDDHWAPVERRRK